jgi:hypothetical protein
VNRIVSHDIGRNYQAMPVPLYQAWYKYCVSYQQLSFFIRWEMIVNYTAAGWEIITQRAHGLLAAQLAYQWQTKYRPEKWLETLLAIAGHDDAELEFISDDLLTATGGPRNFTMKSFDARHCRDQSIYSQARSRYITLLSSMHLVFLYRDEGKTNPEAGKFLKDQSALQLRLRKELQITKAEADGTYALMQWCDALSLMICQHAIQPEHRMTEISKGPDKVSYQLSEVSRNVLTVHPWPFAQRKFGVYVESRNISALRFENAAQFREALYAAKVKENQYTFMK